MPKKKTHWVPVPDIIDPSIFVRPDRSNKAIAIKQPRDEDQGSVAARQNIRPNISRNKADVVEQPSAPQVAHNANERKPSHSADTSVVSVTKSVSKEHDDKQQNMNHSLHPGPESRLNAQLTETLPKATTLDKLSQGTASRSNLDIYARKYVPYWLQAINESPSVMVPAPKLPRMNFDAYVNSYAGTSLQGVLPLPILPPLLTVPLHTAQVLPASFGPYWHERLQNDYCAQAAQNVAFALYGIELTLVDKVQHLYSLKIPGLRESTPRLDLGDILWVRPFQLWWRGNIADLAQEWSRHRQGLAPSFTGAEHHGVVWSVVRRTETVLVRLGTLLSPELKCNVQIPLQAHKNTPSWQAVTLAATMMTASIPEEGKWLRSMLFPKLGVQQTTLSKGFFTADWYDEHLNFEQKRAVQAVIDAEYGVLPFLISGPPGTGKTKTIVEIALQLLWKTTSICPHLLICAPSDAAADTLLVRLSAHLKQEELFRLNNWTRLSSEVSGEVGPYCYLDENQLYSLPKFEKFMSYRVVVTTCRDANVLVTAGLTNRHLSELASRLLRAISPSAPDITNTLHWTALLLDEAAQATEPEALIPLSVVAPVDTSNTLGRGRGAPQFVMAGDEHQLGPRLVSTILAGHSKEFNTNGLNISLFERIFSRDLYVQHPLSRTNGLRPLTKQMLPIIKPPFANLIRNYRSHAAILTTSSHLFYSDTLMPERPDMSAAVASWPRWPKHTPSVWPVFFHQHKSPDSVESVVEGDGTGAGSLMNDGEARIALDTVKDLLNHVKTTTQYHKGYLHEDEVIVMSPFRAQVNHLRQLFRQNGYYDVRIGPLEAFQGLEARIVVICTTRTRLGQPPHPPSKFVNEDRSRNLGIIDEPKSFNVALTRAKEGLIVIGNAEVLTVTRDRCWLNFLEFCCRNGMTTGGKVSWLGKGTGRDDKGAGIGKLEKALKYAENMQASQDMFLSSAEVTRGEGVMPNPAKQSFKFKLKGTMIDLEQRMWDMQVDDEEAERSLTEDQDGEEEDHDVENGFDFEAEAEDE